MICKHCGNPIRQFYGDYTKWTHESGVIYCRMLSAEPEDHEIGSHDAR